jgi:TPR repeat protein
MNQKLYALYLEDQEARSNPLMIGTATYKHVRQKDAQRRTQILLLENAHQIKTRDDFFHAAMIMQHGITQEEFWKAYEFAKKAADLGHEDARWLAASAYDRWLMCQGKRQKYGTQINTDGKSWRLWPYEETTTDEERRHHNIPPLQALLDKVEELNLTYPVPSLDEAPHWLLKVIQNGWDIEPDNEGI